MKKLRTILLSAMAALFALKSPGIAVAGTEPTLCLSPNSYVKMFASSLRSDILQRGHQLAIRAEKSSELETVTAKSDIELQEKLSEAFKKGCRAIIGLYTSRECLIAGPIAKKFSGLILSPTCGHPDIAEYNGWILTAVPSISDYMVAISNFLEKEGLSPVVVFQPTDVFSAATLNLFKDHFRKPFETITLDREGNILTGELIPLSKKALVFLTYPLPSKTVLIELHNKGTLLHETTIIGSSSWEFDSAILKSVMPILNKAKRAISPTIIRHNSMKNSNFYQTYREAFKQEPIGIQGISYDLTRLALKCRKFINSRASFGNCLKLHEYNGVAGPFQLTSTAPFAVRKIELIPLSEIYF